ncbi:hypothetical protein [Streptomyces sp. MH60]|uniref:hypothetical protein n=1 Tax=Streptomyces sp. MH60 TaxID=1940758 RepID=UPI000CEE345A|nr:hypothetical protein [Streptomyces sp. MH60]PPS89526.1 hypothetical protein BZZ08_01672 [Streptomyces sp. MH60]
MNLHVNLDDSWNYILGGLDLVGLVALRAVGQKKAVGWIWAMFTQAVWVIYSLATLQWGFLVPAVIKLALYTWNYVSWVRSDKAEAEAEAKTVEDLALEMAKLVLPDAHGGHHVAAASFLVRASRVAALYPEKADDMHREKGAPGGRPRLHPQLPPSRRGQPETGPRTAD